MFRMSLRKVIKYFDASPKIGKFVIRFRTTVEDRSLVEYDDNLERDIVNFPRPQRVEYPGKVRFGFIPDEWFTIFYDKTGVTGPFALALGATAFLFSKEIYVVDHFFFNGISAAIACTVAVKKFGPEVAAYADKEIMIEERKFQEIRREQIEIYEDAINDEKHEQWRAEGHMFLIEAKRKNIAMQLEAEYRERGVAVYNMVKHHLDCEVEHYLKWRRFSHKHMVMWVSHQVDQSVGSTNLEKLILKQCINHLLSIAPTKHQTSKSGGPGPISAIPYISYSDLWFTHLLTQYAVVPPCPHHHLLLWLRQKANRVFPMTELYV